MRAQPAQKNAEGFGTAAADPGKDHGTCGHEHEGLLAESGAGHEDASQDGPARGREEDAGSCEKDAVSSVPGHAGETVDAEDEQRKPALPASTSMPSGVSFIQKACQKRGREGLM